jgi:hypothetical protein
MLVLSHPFATAQEPPSSAAVAPPLSAPPSAALDTAEDAELARALAEAESLDTEKSAIS